MTIHWVQIGCRDIAGKQIEDIDSSVSAAAQLRIGIAWSFVHPQSLIAGRYATCKRL